MNEFARVDDGSEFNYRSLAVGYRTTAGNEMHDVIATTRKGTVYCFATDLLSDYADVRWQRSLDNQWLSTPAVGDVTGDGENNEVVLTTLWRTGSGCSNGLTDGKIYVLDENGSGQTVAASQSCSYHFRGASEDVPAPGPALADLNGDPGDEIVVATNTSRIDSSDPDPTAMTIHVFEYDGTATLVDHVTSAYLPVGERNDQTGRVFGGEGALYPIGSPIIADIDPDPEAGYAKPDIFVAASCGAVFAFEFDPEASAPDPKLYPKPGWPLLLPDVPREPALVQLTEGQYSMVVQCQDGWLHLYDLPKTTTTSLSSDWPSYGCDAGNTRGRPVGAPSGGMPRPMPESGGGQVRIAGIFPTPTQGNQEILLDAPRAEEVALDVIDIGGRRVREVFAGRLAPGRTRLVWDGLTTSEARAPSGIYWYRLKTQHGTRTERIVFLK